MLLQAQHSQVASASSERHVSTTSGQQPIHNTVMGSPTNDRRLLSATEAWDVLQMHPLYLSGRLDVSKVCERLKEKARCDGMGPALYEDEVCGVIEEVGRSGGDARC